MKLLKKRLTQIQMTRQDYYCLCHSIFEKICSKKTMPNLFAKT